MNFFSFIYTFVSLFFCPFQNISVQQILQFYYAHSLFPDPSMLGMVHLLNWIGLPLPTILDVGDGK